ncbi:MAG: MCE family protein [Nocardioides sp.]
MTTLRRTAKAAALLLVGSVALSGCDFDIYHLPLPGGTDTGDQPLTITAEFTDVLDLVPQSSVKVNEVSVGKITDIELEDYYAVVTMEIQKDTGLPSDAVAEIRQTSLLGEKFVSLQAPAGGGGAAPLESGALIPLDRTGRNPEVEEVLGALSLVLNGGGLAQLKTIAQELNLAFEGREGAARSVLTQIRDLVSTLDDNKGSIVSAIESLNRLALSVREQQGSIESALAELPSALDSLDSQRGDLVRMLTALQRLEGIGVRVIKRSKDVTIQTFRQLQPFLTNLADAGDDLVNAFNVFLTYPFVDEVVGRDPQVARNLHMGDYTNLSVQLNIDLTDPPDLPGLPCYELDEIPDDIPLDGNQLCQDALDAIAKCANNPSPSNCSALPRDVLAAVCDNLPAPLPNLCGSGGRKNTDNGPKMPPLPGLGGLGGLLGIPEGGPRSGLGGLLGRAAPGGSNATDRGPTVGQLMDVYDPALVSLLTPGMVLR